MCVQHVVNSCIYPNSYTVSFKNSSATWIQGNHYYPFMHVNPFCMWPGSRLKMHSAVHVHYHKFTHTEFDFACSLLSLIQKHVPYPK